MGYLPPAKLPFIEPWIFFGSPIPMFSIFFIYFCFLKYGAIYMKDRQPFNLKNVIRVYNVFQIVSCTTFGLLAHFGWGYNVFKATWKCMTYEDFTTDHEEMVYVYTLYWYFFLLRMTELVETIFFVLRKKQDQVSFLHVYHHVSTIFFLYVLNRYSASIMETYIAILNNNVHILMYTYYFFSSFRKFNKYIKMLKPVMTAIQIIQLVFILGQCIAARLCGSTHLFYVISFNVGVLIFFFGEFYYSNYINKKKKNVKVN